MSRAALLPLLALLPLTLDAQPDEAAQRDAVERAVQDYVEGFYHAKPELIERGVHPDLVKYGFARRSSEDPYKGRPMTFDQAVQLADRWNADGRQGEDLTYEIEIFDVADQTACAKLTAKWGIDYFHLAKYDGAWKIRHVMWQTHPPKKG